MPEPLKITTDVQSILVVCHNLRISLEKFYDGIQGFDPTINRLIRRVSRLQTLFETLGSTFEHVEKDRSIGSTGHIDTFWRNLSRSMEDCNAILTSLSERLEDINKTTTGLDARRKDVRRKLAAEQMASYQGQIQLYRSALQLSLRAIILWDEVSTHKVSRSIWPTLRQLHERVRDMRRDLVKRSMYAIAIGGRLFDARYRLQLSKLRQCIEAADTVIASASTVLTEEGVDELSDCDSDLLEPVVNETMRCRNSSVDDGSEEMGHTLKDTSLSDDSVDSTSDSDSDLEDELTMALRRARLNIAAADT